MIQLYTKKLTCDYVQDEKLVVATLATLGTDSGSPSHLIKQDLKLIIQSRRKAEGKAELQVEFKKPVKEEVRIQNIDKNLLKYVDAVGLYKIFLK